MESSNNYERILTELGLIQHYRNGITFPRAIKVGTCPDALETPDLPWNVIRMLMRLDYRARDDFLSKLESETVSGDSESDSSESESGSDIEDDKPNLPPNPMDVLLATFTCCDMILQQSLSENLFLCKLAIPFLYPVSSQGDLVLSLWALRTIIVQSSEANKSSVDISVTDGLFHVITFVRLGHPPKSKSKLLNGILTDGSHETFYSSDCHKKTKRRRIANGMLECAWFLPGAETDSLKLPGVTLFLNLRGDGLSHQRQMDFASKISSLIVILADKEDLTKPKYVDSFERICRESKKVLLLQTNKSKKKKKGKDTEKEMDDTGTTVDKDPERCVTITVKRKMKDDILRNDLTKMIPTLLDHSSKVSLETAAQLYAADGIQVDENSPACLEGKRLAEGLVKEMAGKHTECKRNLLPLQEKTWQRYCDLLKQQCREGSKEETNTDLMKLRREQEEICKNPTNFLHNFLRALVCTESDEVKLYFLQWMKLLLDTKSRYHLPKLRENHHEIWEKQNKAKSLSSAGQDYQEMLNQAGQEIASASFGLEHVFRELGHIYEFVNEKHASVDEEFKIVLEKLPEAVAKLLMAGTPLELVDGDAATVPVTWLKAVLSKLESITGKEKLFIISVLGIQSSGKSTLLNTLFGLKFAVSAGRCTRGAFMQVMEVDRPNFPVKYIAVIDTEGLRAPELAQLKHTHDNELATLAIGLADITLINNKGENTAEMKDILQIAVHAFMRMKLVNRNLTIERSCIFIHQNVSAVDAKTKMRQGCQKLQEQLDFMTKHAAESEGIQDIKRFSQIIRFDIEKHVWYFANLWQGNPPMAPVNLGYSKSATDVKECLLEAIQNQESFSTASTFKTHIRDLWKGILAENFVLSYRNGLEVKAHQAMEKKYCSLGGKFAKSVTSWVTTTADIEIKKCGTLDELATVFDSVQQNLDTVINEETAEIKESLTEFFETNDLKEILIQWKQHMLTVFEQDSAKCRSEKLKHISSTKEDQRKLLQGRAKTEKLEPELMEKANKLASKLKGKEMSECELQKQFETIWKESKIAELAEQEHADDIRVENTMRTILMELFKSNSQLLLEELKRQDLAMPLEHSSLADSITLADVEKQDISMATTIRDTVKGAFSKESPVEQAQRKTSKTTSEILNKLDTELGELRRRNIKFQKGHAEDVIRTLKDHIDRFNQTNAKKEGFSILPTYVVKLAVHVSRHCVQVFTKMQNDYEEKHGIATHVKNSRERAWTVFHSTVKQCTEEVIAAKLFCNELKSIIKKKIKSDIPQLIKDEVDKDFETKSDLIVKLLENLADEDDFANFVRYIECPDSFALRWITTYTNNKMFHVESGRSMSRCRALVEANIGTIMDCVETNIKHAKTKKSGNLIGVWLSTFCEMKEIPVSTKDFEDVEKREIKASSRFTEYILQELESMKMTLVKDLPEDKTWKSIAPYQEILDEVWGCTALCPFCKEPCKHIRCHYVDHECLQHRPQGVASYRWIKWLFWGGQLATETCNNLVASGYSFSNPDTSGHPYRQYKEIYAKWEITGESSSTVSRYWAWFMARYKEKLADEYHAEMPKIPPEWARITKTEAKESLDE